MTSRRFAGAALRSGMLLAGGFLLAVSGSLASCGQSRGRLSGQMFIPPGMRGSAQWGDIWLVRDYEKLRGDLNERERVLVLSLLGKEADFMRAERDALLELAAIREKLNVLNRGEMPLRVVLPPRREIGVLTSLDSVIAGVRVVSRSATAPELATEIDVQKQRLKDSMREIRGKLEPSVGNLRLQRSDQKRTLLAGADEVAARVRVAQTSVGMDGRYFFDNVARGEYGLYSRYRLLEWFVIAPVRVTPGVVVKDIPRLPGAVVDSKVTAALDALCAEIARL